MKSAGHVLGFYFAAVFFSTKGDAVIDMDKFIFFLYESLLYVGIMFHFANVQRRNYVGILPSLLPGCKSISRRHILFWVSCVRVFLSCLCFA